MCQQYCNSYKVNYSVECAKWPVQCCNSYTIINTVLNVPGPVCMGKGFATLWVNATQEVSTLAVRIWFGSHAWVTEEPAGSELSVIFRWWNSFWGFPVIRASTHARQVIQSLLPVWLKKKKKKNSWRAECKWEDKTGQETQLYSRRDHCAPRRSGYE